MSGETADDRAAARARRVKERERRREPAARRWSAILIGGGHLAVLWALAVAQPLFDLLGKNPEFFAVRGSTPREIVGFALVLTLAAPVAMLAVELLAALLSHGLQAALHLVFIAALVVLIALQAGNHAVENSGALVLVAAVALGVAGALAYARVSAIRLWLTILLPVPLVFVGLFLFNTPVSKLLIVDAVETHAAPVDTTTPVVLLVFDELPTISLLNGRGEIDASLFPNFASVAARSTWYLNATTVSPSTHQAVPAILTGNTVRQGKLPVLEDYPDNLFTLLGQSYDMRVLERLTHLCPTDLCTQDDQDDPPGRLDSLGKDLFAVYLHLVVPDNLADGLPPVGDTWTDFFGEPAESEDEGARPTAALPSCSRGVCNFAESIGPTQRPALYFFHALLPHMPWMLLPSGRRYVHDVRLIPGINGPAWGTDQWLIEQGYQRHLLQLGYTDRALGLILDRLRENGLYDRSLVVVTADHGLSFEPGEPRRRLSDENLDSLAFVPLFVKLPGQRKPRVRTTFARTIDIVPTIADVLGVSLTWKADGRSLLSGRQRRDGRVVVSNPDTGSASARLSELLPRRAQELARKLAWFGDGDGWKSIVEIGPHAELIGTDVAAGSIVASAARVELNGGSLFSSVDMDGGFLPSYVTGSVTGGAGGGTDLAIAVNGRIAAVTRTYSGDGERFAVILPDEALSQGANDVQMYAVGGGTPAQLAALEGVSVTYTLKNGGSSRIEVSGQSAIPIAKSDLHGAVRALSNGDTMGFGGFAVDLKAKRGADRIIVFAGRKGIYAGRSGNANVRGNNARFGVGEAGFLIEIPTDVLPEPGSATPVRVFAVLDGVAVELRYPKSYPWATT